MKNKLTIVALASVLFPGLVTAQNARVIIQAEAGYSIEWNGNNGNHFDSETGAESPENDAWDAFSFASSNYFPDGIHDAVNVVDGYYGNSSSWIATRADADPWLDDVRAHFIAAHGDDGDGCDDDADVVPLTRWRGAGRPCQPQEDHVDFRCHAPRQFRRIVSGFGRGHYGAVAHHCDLGYQRHHLLAGDIGAAGIDFGARPP